MSALTIYYFEKGESEPERVEIHDVTKTSHTITGLELEEYVFILVAENAATPPNGVHAPTDPRVTVIIAPPTISGLTGVSDTSGNVLLNWVPGGGDAPEMWVTYSRDGSALSVSQVVEPGENRVEVPDLPTGEYTFWVFAVNAADPDPSPKDTTTVTVVNVAPPTISDFTASQNGDKQVELTWDLGGGALTSLTLEYTDGDGTDQSVTLGTTATSHTLINLPLGDYTFDLYAVNAAAPDPGVKSTTDPALPVIAPPTISNFRGSQTGDKQVELTWDLGGGDLESLTLEYTDGDDTDQSDTLGTTSSPPKPPICLWVTTSSRWSP